MQGTDFFEKLAAYGADMRGVNDRFAGDAELYERCYREFLDEPNFAQLERAVADCDYGAAFEAAHALKGLSGNLGLTPFYDAVCVLVEALRSKAYPEVGGAYRAVLEQLRRLAPEGPVDLPAQTEATAAVLPAPKKARKSLDPFVVRVGTSLITAVVIVALLFIKLIDDYGKRMDIESASHLVEINNQLKLYIEDRIETDWMVASSVANNLVRMEGAAGSDTRLVDYLKSVRDIWNVSEIILLTADGVGVRTDGRGIAVDKASDMAYYALHNGEYLSIIQSELTYTVPVETEMTINGARIVAVSVVQALDSFLDNMGFSSFDATAYMYLTQLNGAVISKLTHQDTSPAFNIMSLLNGRELVRLSDGREANLSGDLFTSDAPVTYLLRDPRGDRYVVSTPIVVHSGNMRLFYVAPEAVVNRTMNDFSNSITLLSGAFILLFAIFAFLVFLLVFKSSKRRYDKSIRDHERMFDLLVQNTKTAFGMFSTKDPEPLYISPNSPGITGFEKLRLERAEDGRYRMRLPGDEETAAIRQINRELTHWDGTGEFRSGYILSDAVPGTGYYVIQLFPVDTDGAEYVGIAQDVTGEHDREETVRVALAMAERSNEAKTRFLSNMSHDIRTPMNAIINMTNFALESVAQPKKLREYLNVIRESAAHLLRLINDVLDMSRIESGQAVIGSAPFDLRAELDKIADIMRPLCKSKHQTLLADFSGVRAGRVRGDQMKVSQVLVNLLSNAVKFTPEWGAIRFIAKEIPSIRQELVDIRFTVEDNGIGIAKEDIGRVFEPFMRADDYRVGAVEGTGLGLSICKSYVMAMGGTITCESETENGSKFTVELFFEQAEPEEVAQAERRVRVEQPFAGRHCLLCEDNETNQMIAKTILERLGFLVELANDGREGAARFRASAPGYYDIVYMDIRMPHMDGYEAAVAIRESDHPQAGTIPIVALSANVFAEDIEKARLAGMNGHLGKPIIVLDLIDETDRVLKIGRTGT